MDLGLMTLSTVGRAFSFTPRLRKRADHRRLINASELLKRRQYAVSSQTVAQNWAPNYRPDFPMPPEQPRLGAGMDSPPPERLLKTKAEAVAYSSLPW